MIRELERTERDGAHWEEIQEERIPARQRWSIRAAQWRALELARSVFGESASLHSGGFPPRGAFQGLVHLAVPFRTMDEHRDGESRFVALASADELLGSVPLVFVFDPVPTGSPAGRLP